MTDGVKEAVKTREVLVILMPRLGPMRNGVYEYKKGAVDLRK